MIDLNWTRERMLAEINASEGAFQHRLDSPVDPRFSSLDEAHLIIQGQTPKDAIFTELDAALLNRYSYLPAEQFFIDLQEPLKSSIGNAYKRGNCEDSNKYITVETVVTRTGAFISVSDEGQGFDVESVVRRLQGGENYFTFRGLGFQRFAKSRSIISYINGGSTVLICFRRFFKQRVPNTVCNENPCLVKITDEEWVRDHLVSHIDSYETEAVLETCHVYIPEIQKSNGVELKYTLGYRSPLTRGLYYKTLTGRLLSESAIKADFSAVQQLYQLPFNQEEHPCVPRPIAIFDGPPLALYEFNPRMNLRRYVKRMVSRQERPGVIQSMGKGLRTLHQSAIILPKSETVQETFARYTEIKERVLKKLLLANPQQAAKLEQLYCTLMSRVKGLKNDQLAPTYGALGWNRIFSDYKQLYFYGFEQSHYAHPGFDVGGFLVDLLRFYTLQSKHPERDTYRTNKELFLNAYFSNTQLTWSQDIPFFMGCAMLLRLRWLLEQSKSKQETQLGAFFEEYEQILS